MKKLTLIEWLAGVGKTKQIIDYLKENNVDPHSIRLIMFNRSLSEKVFLKLLDYYKKIVFIRAIKNYLDSQGICYSGYRSCITISEELQEGCSITCSTIHQSKGLEADAVFLMDFQAPEGGENEVCISYTAMSSARNRLILTSVPPPP
jgi:superfamily I DNA/RNA helicase